MQSSIEIILEALTRSQSNRNKKLRKRRAHRPKNRKRSMAAKRAARKIPKSARRKRAKKATKTKRRLHEQSISSFILEWTLAGYTFNDIMHLLHEHIQQKENRMENQTVNATEMHEGNDAFPMSKQLMELINNGVELDAALDQVNEGGLKDAIKKGLSTAGNTLATGASSVGKGIAIGASVLGRGVKAGGSYATHGLKDIAQDAVKGYVHGATENDGVIRTVFSQLNRNRNKPSLGQKAKYAGLGALGLAAGIGLKKGFETSKKESDILKQLERRAHMKEPDIYPHPSHLQPNMQMFAPMPPQMHQGVHYTPTHYAQMQQMQHRAFAIPQRTFEMAMNAINGNEVQLVEQTDSKNSNINEELKDMIINDLVSSYTAKDNANEEASK